jgi:hypothetical protein
MIHIGFQRQRFTNEKIIDAFRNTSTVSFNRVFLSLNPRKRSRQLY